MISWNPHSRHNFLLPKDGNRSSLQNADFFIWVMENVRKKYSHDNSGILEYLKWIFRFMEWEIGWVISELFWMDTCVLIVMVPYEKNNFKNNLITVSCWRKVFYQADGCGSCTRHVCKCFVGVATCISVKILFCLFVFSPFTWIYFNILLKSDVKNCHIYKI